MKPVSENQLNQIREASRNLVRTLGFLNNTLADTGYSASAVHAIIEIGGAGCITARELSDILGLEKSTVSRLIQQLIKDNEIRESRSDEDARKKNLNLTKKGQSTLAKIDSFAKGTVENALLPLNPFSRETIRKGLKTYSDALNGKYDKDEAVVIHDGYIPGLIGDVSSLHATLYEKIVNFGPTFEIKVASGLAEFIARIDNPENNIWYVKQDDKIKASITIDGEDLGDNHAHLRWFIVDSSLQSSGIGSLLLRKALEFCDVHKFDEVHLWTFKGLDAARTLYERNGFVIADEYPNDHWGTQVMEQKFVRRITSQI